MLPTKLLPALDTLIAFLVVLVSGNPAILNWYPRAVFIGLLFLLVCMAVVRGVHKIKVADAALVAAFAAITLLHLMAFSTAVMSASAGFWVHFLIALFAVRVVEQFHLRYTKIIYLLAVISLCFYGTQHLLELVGIDLRAALSGFTLLSDGRVHIGLHNFHLAEEAHRNSGLFWEPGAFAGYLVLGLVLLAGYKHEYAKRMYRRVLLVLVLATVTTLSVAGLLLLPLVLAMHFVPAFRQMTAALRTLSVTVTLGLGVAISAAILWTQPIVSEKVVHQLESTMLGTQGAELTRFGSIVYDLEFIRSRPIAGWSPHPVARAALDPYSSEIATGQGNGLTGFIVKFGLLGLLLFTLSIYSTFSRLFASSKIRPLFATLLILAMLNGEAFLNYPLLMTLMFTPKRKHTRNLRSPSFGQAEVPLRA